MTSLGHPYDELRWKWERTLYEDEVNIIPVRPKGIKLIPKTPDAVKPGL